MDDNITNTDNKMVITPLPAMVKAPPKLRNVAAYARVSSGKDAMLHSLAAQVSYYSGYIQNNPTWNYCGVYADEDFTGTKDTRPEFQRLIADCREGKVDMVITKSVSRFARNTITTLSVVRELKLLGVDCYFEDEHVHSISGEGELMLTLLAAYAQEESLSVSENCKWKIRHGFQDGRPTYTSPFGYQMVKGKLIVVPEEAEIVKSIFAMFLSGMGRNAIMKRLEEDNVFTRGGIRFGESVIRSMLENEKYVGDLCLQKTFIADHLSKRECVNNGELPMYYVHNDHEAIIDRETFELVQAELAQRADTHTSKRGQVSPFTGMIICGNCGQHYHKKTTGGKATWKCMTYIRHGKAACQCKQIPDDVLYQLTADVLGLEVENFDKGVLNGALTGALMDAFKNAFTVRIKELRIPAFNHIVFVFKDGHEEDRVWQDRSRADSWTDEMREGARRDINKRWKK